MAARTAKIIAPTIGERLATLPVAERKRAIPIPPKTAWLIAPANPAILLTVTTVPNTPKSTEERRPAKRAFLKKGAEELKRALKKLPIGGLL
jgi:hypothetical protein